MAGERAVGIDLGTTRTTVATVADGRTRVLENGEGSRTTPSVVRYRQTDDGVVAVAGQAAAEARTMYPDETVTRIKRHMGEEDYRVRVHGREYTPAEVSANVLEKVVSDAERRLDGPVTEAVITVPAYFGDRERQNTRDAARLIGLEVDKILDEPTAACLAYGLAETDTTDGTEHVFVYDLGGGTFDATLVEVTYTNTLNTIEAQNTEGFDGLGGEDWDDVVAEWILDRIERESGVDVRADPEAMSRVTQTACEAKETLSEQRSTTVRIPYVTDGYNFEAELSRERFDEMTADLLDRTFEACDRLFDRAALPVDDVDTVLLCGGSTRMPQVQDAVADYFGQDPSKEVNPDEAVARGAAVAAAIEYDPNAVEEMLPGESGSVVTSGVVPRALGLRNELPPPPYKMLIEVDDPLPAVGDVHGWTTVKDYQEWMEFEVYEGPGPIDGEDTYRVGTARLDGIRQAPQGEPNIYVEFTVDEQGLLTLYAEDEDTGATVEATIEDTYRRSEDEIADIKKGLPPNEG